MNLAKFKFFCSESCIRRWLQECANPKSCPHCKTKATSRDIRFIYATKIRVIDNSVELELQRRLQSMQDEKVRLVTENSLNSMQVAVQKAEIRRLKEEIEMLRNSVQIETGRATAGIRTIKSGRIYLEKNLDFNGELGCRFIRFLYRTKKLIVTQKAGVSLFPGFGVRLIDFPTYRKEKFINTSTKVINDFSIDSNETFVVTVSREATCKMYNIASGVSVNSFTPTTVPLWTCAFDVERPHNLYLGAQNGSTYIYDIRQPNDVMKEVSALDNRRPVKYTIPMKRNESFPHGGFFVVHTCGIYFYEYLPSTEIASTTLNFTDPILVVTYDERTEMLLITKSPTGQGAVFKQTRHILMKLVKEDGIPVLQEIYSFNGSSSTFPSLSRPSQIKVPDGFIVASYLEDTKMMQARSPSVGLLHETSISDAITDICPIYLDNSFFFGALSPSRCRLFKVNLGY